VKFLTGTGQGTINDTQREIVENLDIRYPPGQCQKHPKRQCFLHKPTNLHFDIADASGRKTVWAVAMVRTLPLGLPALLTSPNQSVSQADYDNPPMSSRLFKPEQAMKHSAAHTVDATSAPAAAAPSLAAAPPAVSPFPPNPYGPYSAPPHHAYYPPPPPPPYYHPHFSPYGPPPLAPPAAQHLAGPSSPRRGRVPMIPIAVFCERYDLEAEIEQALEKMRFRPGQSLSALTERDWNDGGLTRMQSLQVVEANSQYRDDCTRK
jgi:hypothetical protein